MCGRSIRELYGAIPSADAYRALHVVYGDAAKAIRQFERALYLGGLHGAIIVDYRGIAGYIGHIDAPEGVF